MRIILVRHGQTYKNMIHPRLQDHKNASSSLTSKGKKQAAILARHLKEYNIKKIYASDLERAIDTANAIARYHKLRPVHKEEFREILGNMTGSPYGKKDKKDIRFRTRRANKGWDIIKLMKSSGDILIVCHGGFIRWIVSKVLDVSPKKMYPFRIHNCSLTVLEKKSRSRKPFTINLVNGVTHLPKKYVSEGAVY